ncbi:UNVERIFIED_CONTAM: hypothetical protein HHA_449010 [Hammondia hammondi]|eukprot:XP_008881632.1 hypothetical protein HHA_449010 [Hammondia hammondi]
MEFREHSRSTSERATGLRFGRDLKQQDCIGHGEKALSGSVVLLRKSQTCASRKAPDVPSRCASEKRRMMSGKPRRRANETPEPSM